MTYQVRTQRHAIAMLLGDDISSVTEYQSSKRHENGGIIYQAEAGNMEYCIAVKSGMPFPESIAKGMATDWKIMGSIGGWDVYGSRGNGESFTLDTRVSA